MVRYPALIYGEKGACGVAFPDLLGIGVNPPLPLGDLPQGECGARKTGFPPTGE